VASDERLLVEPVARPVNARRIRPDAVWAEVRKAWEEGETARSVARRYDVGVPALWKRREAEGWKRPDPQAGPVEPAEGWEAVASRRMTRFLTDLETQRELALGLLAVLEGGRPEDMSAWHLGFYYRWRAERLGEAVAAADRERVADQDWAEAIWDADGRLRPQWQIDLKLMRMHRDDWCHPVGLPVDVAPDVP